MMDEGIAGPGDPYTSIVCLSSFNIVFCCEMGTVQKDETGKGSGESSQDGVENLKPALYVRLTV